MIEEYHDDKREFEDVEPCDDDMFYHDEDHEPHGLDCDCPDCRYEHAISECGQLPQHLGRGCTMAGTEFCDFECPLRDDPEDHEATNPKDMP